MFQSPETHDNQDPAGSLLMDAAVDPVGFLTVATEVLAKLPSELWRTGNDGFAGIAAGLDALSVQLDCTLVAVLQGAESRGIVDQSPSTSSAAWLLEHSRHLEPGDASRTAKLAHLLTLPKNQTMAAAVAGGTVTTRKAMTALRQLGQVEHDLAPGKREEALASLTQMAQTGCNAHVVAVGRMLMALLGADQALEDNETALSTLNSLRLSPLENGMTAVNGQLDPESAAVLSAALDPLSAPNPTTEEGGEPDRRPADRRRAEALIEICRRATAAGGEAPTTSKAQVVVLIDLEYLKDPARGAGTTLDGQVFSPGLVRKLACAADSRVAGGNLTLRLPRNRA